MARRNTSADTSADASPIDGLNDLARDGQLRPELDLYIAGW